MYLSTWQINAIERCYYEKYSENEDPLDNKPEEEINNMIEAEINSLENSDNYSRVSKFMEKAKTIPTKGMLNDLENLNKIFAFMNLKERNKEFAPLKACEYKFNRFKLEMVLKENRSLLRSHKLMTPRQKETLINMGLDAKIAEIVPQSEFENYYSMLKDSNLVEDLFDDETLEKNRKTWLDPDTRESRKYDDKKGGELEF